MESEPTLAEQRSEVTRRAIRSAVVELLRTEHPAQLSMPAVAARAGMSVRTLYRYFPTKQALLDDVAEIQIRRVEEVLSDREALFLEPDKSLRLLWEEFARDLDAVRAQHLSPLGADLRTNRLAATRNGVQMVVDQLAPDVDAGDRRRLADLLIMVTSSSAFLELHERLGLAPADAAEGAMWIVRAMQEKFIRDRGFGDEAATRPDRST